MLDRGVFVEFAQSGNDHHVSRIVSYSYHPEWFNRSGKSLTPGSSTTDLEKLCALAIQRMIDVCMALPLGMVNKSIYRLRTSAYQPMNVSLLSSVTTEEGDDENDID